MLFVKNLKMKKNLVEIHITSLGRRAGATRFGKNPYGDV